LGIKLKGMEGNPHLAKQHAALEKSINQLAEEVKSLRREHSENLALLQSLTARLERLKAGGQDDPRAHVRHLAEPVKESRTFRNEHAAETWAAISLSLMLFAIAALVFFPVRYMWAGVAIIVILFLVADSVLRGAFIQTIGQITLVLAMLATLILLFHFGKWVLAAGLVVIGVSLMVQRLRELTG
jgi:ABC-type multidrug transport system fused ATPase/permease subunit